MLLASIPSPSVGVWYLGFFPLRAYALAIICGIFLAVWVLYRRYRARGGDVEVIPDLAFWGVIFGIIGARVYHVITDYQLYFGPGRDPWRVFFVWEGGLGIWGGVIAGSIAVWITARRRGLNIGPIADSLAPGLILAQAVGRIGNYFNQELFGKPTTLPWGLEIDLAHLPEGYAPGTLFHPTFLYEMLWSICTAIVLVLLDKRFKLAHGQVFALYVAGYALGRSWIEMIRIDSAHVIAGLRVNVWMSLIMMVGAIAVFIYLRRRYQGVPDSIYMAGHEPSQEKDHTEAH